MALLGWHWRRGAFLLSVAHAGDYAFRQGCDAGPLAGMGPFSFPFSFLILFPFLFSISSLLHLYLVCLYMCTQLKVHAIGYLALTYKAILL